MTFSEKSGYNVAPFAGAWIEIYSFYEFTQWQTVAPFAGAWIEIEPDRKASAYCFVAPFAGAWIEISFLLERGSMEKRRSLRGSVD